MSRAVVTGKSITAAMFRLVLLGLCLLAVHGCGCREGAAQETAQKILAAFVNRDQAQLPLGALGAQIDRREVVGGVKGPVIFAGYDILGVRKVSEGKTDVFEVEYQVKASDYASALFNSLAQDQVLEGNPAALGAYQSWTVLKGQLRLACRDGKLVVEQKPGLGDPMVVACEMALARAKWLEYMASGPRGPEAAGRFLRLVNLSGNQAFGKAIGRGQALKQVARLLRGAGEQTPGSVVRGDIVGSGPQLADALEVLSGADAFLFAWFQGTPEKASRHLYWQPSEGRPLQMASQENLKHAPVKLRAYEIVSMRKGQTGEYALNVKMQVSDPASVLAVATCTPELKQPREQIALIEDGVIVEERLNLFKRGEDWVIVAKQSAGALGYLSASGQAVDRMSRHHALFNIVKTEDTFLVATEVSIRLAMIKTHFADLDFSPLGRNITAGIGLGDLLEPTVKRVMKLTDDLRILAGMSDDKLAFLLGAQLSEYAMGQLLASSLLPRTDELMGKLEKTRKTCALLLKGLDLPGMNDQEIDSLLKNLVTRGGGNIDDKTKPIARLIYDRHGARTETVFMVGRDLSVLANLTVLQKVHDKLTKAVAAQKGRSADELRQDFMQGLDLMLNTFFVLRQLENNMLATNARPQALAALDQWKSKMLAVQDVPEELFNRLSRYEEVYHDVGPR